MSRADKKVYTSDFHAKITSMRDALARNGNWNNSAYMCGLHNGVELALSVIEQRDPVYRDKPKKGWLSKEDGGLDIFDDGT